jgi:hypothetical protein
MKITAQKKLLGFFIIIVVFIGVFAYQSGKGKNTIEAQETVIETNEDFLNLIGNDFDLNNGIGIDIETSSYEYPADIVYVVLNHTSETIQFENQGYGVDIYFGDEELVVWEKGEFNSYPVPMTTLLSPFTEAFEVGEMNYWRIPAEYLPLAKYSIVRIFVEGVGIDSGKHYGAYQDIKLKND